MNISCRTMLAERCKHISLPSLSLEIVSDIQSTPFKTDTFGTDSNCLSWRGVRLIESQVKEVKRGRDQL